MSLIRVQCSKCKKGMWIDDKRFEKGNAKIYCSRKRCKVINNG